MRPLLHALCLLALVPFCSAKTFRGNIHEIIQPISPGVIAEDVEIVSGIKKLHRRGFYQYESLTRDGTFNFGYYDTEPAVVTGGLHIPTFGWDYAYDEFSKAPVWIQLGWFPLDDDMIWGSFSVENGHVTRFDFGAYSPGENYIEGSSTWVSTFGILPSQTWCDYTAEASLRFSDPRPVPDAPRTALMFGASAITLLCLSARRRFGTA